MTLFLNILFVLVSILFFTGRLYEVVFLMEEGTNFLTQAGIVTSPLMICIVLLISVCCGVLIFSGKNQGITKLKIPVGLFGFVPAILFVVTSVLNLIRIFTITSGFLGYDLMMILASVGLVIYGIKGIKGKNSEKLPMIFTILFPIAMCMDVVILSIKPLADTFFFYRSMSAVTNLAFFLALYKNAYSPSNLSRPLLYVTALMNFLISTAANLAGLIGGMVTSSLALADITMNAALVVIGLFSLFTAFYIIPENGTEKAAVSNKPVKRKKGKVDEYEESGEFAIPGFEVPVSQSSYSDSLFIQETETRQINKISEDTIAMLFAQKDEREKADSVNIAAKEKAVETPVEQSVKKQPVSEETKAMPAVKQTVPKTEKSVFKSTGAKKSSTAKTVYKAPKK